MVGGRVEAAIHDVKLERARTPLMNGKGLAGAGGALGE